MSTNPAIVVTIARIADGRFDWYVRDDSERFGAVSSPEFASDGIKDALTHFAVKHGEVDVQTRSMLFRSVWSGDHGRWDRIEEHIDELAGL